MPGKVDEHWRNESASAVRGKGRELPKRKASHCHRSLAYHTALAVAPQDPVVDFQFALLGLNGLAESPRINRIAGGRLQLRQMAAPELIECPHGQFAKIL